MAEYYKLAPIKVAAVQAGSVFRDAPEWLDLSATLDKAIGLIEEAGGKGARLVVFPECFVPCYTYWSYDVTDRPTFNEMWAKLLWNSIEVPGREVDALCAAAKRANSYVVMGITERDPHFPGRMYNSILYLSPEGKVLGTHRKISNTVQERFFHTPGGGGDNLKAVFPTEIGNISGTICGEHCQLALVYNWIMQGMQIHCSLWPGDTGLETVMDIMSRAACYSAKAFGIISAAYVREEDRPRNFHRNSRFAAPGNFRGGSGIVGPDGRYIVGPVYDKETVVYADINLADTDRSRIGTNLTGIYSRWDLINLNVSMEPCEPIVPMKGEAKSFEELEDHIRQVEKQLAGLTEKKRSKR